MTTHRSTKPKKLHLLTGEPPTRTSKQKPMPYLGLLISDNLKWSSHINKITNRATSTLGFLRRNLKQCSKTLKETAYTSLVISVLD